MVWLITEDLLVAVVGVRERETTRDERGCCTFDGNFLRNVFVLWPGTYVIVSSKGVCASFSIFCFGKTDDGWTGFVVQEWSSTRSTSTVGYSSSLWYKSVQDSKRKTHGIQDLRSEWGRKNMQLWVSQSVIRLLKSPLRSLRISTTEWQRKQDSMNKPFSSIECRSEPIFNKYDNSPGKGKASKTACMTENQPVKVFVFFTDIQHRDPPLIYSSAELAIPPHHWHIYSNSWQTIRSIIILYFSTHPSQRDE